MRLSVGTVGPVVIAGISFSSVSFNAIKHSVGSKFCITANVAATLLRMSLACSDEIFNATLLSKESVVFVGFSDLVRLRSGDGRPAGGGRVWEVGDPSREVKGWNTMVVTFRYRFR